MNGAKPEPQLMDDADLSLFTGKKSPAEEDDLVKKATDGKKKKSRFLREGFGKTEEASFIIGTRSTTTRPMQCAA